MGMGGGYVGNCERVGVIIECAVGDKIQVKGVTGNEEVYMDVNYSWFEGYLLAGSSQLSTSQQYYFKVTSNLNNNQLLASGSVLANFNQIVYDVPSGNYDTTAGAVKYVIPVAGTYQFFFQTFQNSPYSGAFRLGIFKNGILEGMTGAFVANTERMGVILECAVGDGIDVRWVSGSGYLYMSNLHSWFEGYLLQPENNTITDTTNLTVNSLTADISPNLNAGSNISISTTSGVSTISSSIEYLIMTNTSDFTMTGTGASTYSLVFNNTKTTSSNINYNALTQEFSFNSNGTYLVSFSCNVFNTGHNGRLVGRTRVVKNGSYTVGDGVCYFYIRDDNYGNRETCSLSNCPIFITNFSTDKIKLNFTCNKDSAGGFGSNLTGLLQAEGCLVSFVKIA